MSRTGKTIVALLGLAVLGLAALCYELSARLDQVTAHADRAIRIAHLLETVGRSQLLEKDLAANDVAVALSEPIEDPAEGAPAHHFRYARLDPPPPPLRAQLTARGWDTTDGLLSFGFDAEGRLVGVEWGPP